MSEKGHTPRPVIERLLADLRAGTKALDAASTSQLCCDAATTLSLLRAANENPKTTMMTWAGHTTQPLVLTLPTTKTVSVAGHIAGDLTITAELGALYVSSDVEGHVVVNREIRRDLRVSGAIASNLLVREPVGSIEVSGHVKGKLMVVSRVRKHVRITGSVSDDVRLRSTSVLGGDLKISGSVGADVLVTGRIDGSVRIHGAVGRNVFLVGSVTSSVQFSNSSNVGGYVSVHGAIASGGQMETALELAGAVEGNVRIDGRIDGAVAITGGIGDSLSIAATIDAPSAPRALDIGGSVGHNFVIGGTVHGRVSLRARIGGQTRLTPVNVLNVVTFRCAFDGPALVGENVQLHECDVDGLVGIDYITFTGSSIFPRRRGRLVIHDRTASGGMASGQLAAVYRQFRRSLEKSGNRPGAGDFYFGECEARRKALRGAKSFSARAERTVLLAYKVVSGYGTRASYALGWYAGVCVAGAVLFTLGGFELPDGTSVSVFGAGPFKGLEVVLFALQSTVSFFRPPTTSMSVTEAYLQLALRFSGPILLAQAAFSLRERIAR